MLERKHMIGCYFVFFVTLLIVAVATGVALGTWRDNINNRNSSYVDEGKIINFCSENVHCDNDVTYGYNFDKFMGYNCTVEHMCESLCNEENGYLVYNHENDIKQTNEEYYKCYNILIFNNKTNIVLPSTIDNCYSNFNASTIMTEIVKDTEVELMLYGIVFIFVVMLFIFLFAVLGIKFYVTIKSIKNKYYDSL